MLDRLIILKIPPKQYSYVCQQALILHKVKLNWDFITNFFNVNEDCEKLTLKLMQSIDQAKRIKLANFSSKTPCLTPAILQSCLRIHNLFKQMQSRLITKTAYKTYQKYVTKIVRELKKQYYSEICSKNAHNSKIIWKHLSHLLSRKAFTSAPKDLDCNTVNKFFSNLGPSTVVNLPSPKSTIINILNRTDVLFYD